MAGFFEGENMFKEMKRSEHANPETIKSEVDFLLSLVTACQKGHNKRST